MLQVRGDADFAEEPIGAEHGAELGVEELDRHMSLVPDIIREIDGRHAAGANLAFDRVPVGESFGQSQEVGRQWNLISLTADAMEGGPIRGSGWRAGRNPGARAPRLRAAAGHRRRGAAVAPCCRRN